MQDNQDVVIETKEYAVVLGMQAYISSTDEGDPLLVMRLDTDNADAKQVLWSFDEEHFQVFVRSILRYSELFSEGNNAETSETEA